MALSGKTVNLSREAIEYMYTWKVERNAEWQVENFNEVFSPRFEMDVAGWRGTWSIGIFRLTENGLYFIIRIDKCLVFEPLGKFMPLGITFWIVNKRGDEVNHEKIRVVRHNYKELLISRKWLDTDFFFDEKNGLVVNGECTLKFRFYVFPDMNNFKPILDRPPRPIVLDDLEKLLESKAHSDVKLIVRDKEFHVHKCILAARSRVFSAMFAHDLRENNRNVVEINDVNTGPMKELLRFVYAGRVDNIETNAKDLLAAAEKYEIEELKALCENELAERLNVNNAGESLALADMYGARKLRMQAIKFIVRNKNAISKETLKEVTKSVSFSPLEVLDILE